MFCTSYAYSLRGTPRKQLLPAPQAKGIEGSKQKNSIANIFLSIKISQSLIQRQNTKEIERKSVSQLCASN